VCVCVGGGGVLLLSCTTQCGATQRGLFAPSLHTFSKSVYAKQILPLETCLGGLFVFLFSVIVESCFPKCTMMCVFFFIAITPNIICELSENYRAFFSSIIQLFLFIQFKLSVLSTIRIIRP